MLCEVHNVRYHREMKEKRERCYALAISPQILKHMSRNFTHKCTAMSHSTNYTKNIAGEGFRCDSHR